MGVCEHVRVLAELLYRGEGHHTEENAEHQRKKLASLTRSLCNPEPLRANVIAIPHTSSHPFVERIDHTAIIYQLMSPLAAGIIHLLPYFQCFILVVLIYVELYVFTVQLLLVSGRFQKKNGLTTSY